MFLEERIKCNDRKETVFDFTVDSLYFAGGSAGSLDFVDLPGRQSTKGRRPYGVDLFPGKDCRKVQTHCSVILRRDRLDSCRLGFGSEG